VCVITAPPRIVTAKLRRVQHNRRVSKVLLSEELAPSCIETLQNAGHEVIVALDQSPEQLQSIIGDVNALIIRSATQVDDALLAAANNLVVVGRAGVGLDNVDVPAATNRGVMVVNAPMSNIVSAAEQAMALLMCVARNTPQAHAALKAGKWQRSKWEGVELAGKTLAIIGLGRVGALVADRARAFDMRLVAYDPFVTPDRAQNMGVEMLGIEDAVAQADFITIHLPKTPETIGLFGEKLLAKCKQGARIINTARGGIIDEEALAQAIASGHIGGAGLDVFAKEPTTESPLFALDQVVVAPHLGASTAEAQDKAGQTIAEQVVLALAGEFVPFAVNVKASEAAETVRPFLPVAELLGSYLGQLCASMPTDEIGVLQCTYEGDIAEYDTKLLTLSVQKGFFGVLSTEPVTYVNAPQRARELNVEVRGSTSDSLHDYVNQVILSAGGHTIAGTVVGKSGEARITMIDDHDVETKPAANMFIVRNDDRPGIIGAMGSLLGQAGVSITNMAVGQSPSGNTALMIVATADPVSDAILDELRAQDGIISINTIARRA
jgi:D-3-phosphoglycerate dehydrogenase